MRPTRIGRTVPFRLKPHFVRARFQEVDPSLCAPSLFGKAPE